MYNEHTQEASLSMPYPSINLIVAMSQNNVIGVENQLPWHLPDDLKHFRSLTIGTTVIMGRKTHESIGKPLPKRDNIIISKTIQHFPGCLHASDVNAAITLARQKPKPIFIIGGASIYAQTIAIADHLYLTQIAAQIKGDAFFPSWNPNDWRLVQHQTHDADEQHAHAFSLLQYQRLTNKHID